MAGETRMAINWRGIAKTGLAYGGGLMAGNIVSQVLFGVLSPEPYGMLGEAARLLIGILMVMLITGLGGALGGFLGGWTLPVTGEPKGKYGYAWRSAISLGIVYGTFLLLIVFALSALTLRDAAFMPAGPFMKVYLFIGLISGALIGLLLGLTTVGWRRTGSVIIASIVGFSFGGVAFGAGVWAYMRSAPAGGIREGNHVLLLLALFGFGLFGGLAIGFAFDRFARKDKGHRLSPMGPWMRYSLIVLAVLFALWLLVQLRPALAFAADMLTPRAAMQTETIASDSAGSHWQESSEVTTAASEIAALDLSVGESSDLALVWSEVIGDAREVQLQAGTSSADGGTDWAASTNVSHSATDSQYPSVFVDAEGVAHVAWLEGDSGIAHYSRCLDGDCTDAAPLADAADACPSGGGRPDTLSIEVAASHDGTVMVVWSDPKGGLHYRILPDGTQGCVPSPRGSTMGSFSLDGGPSSGFSMALDDSQGSIWLTAFEDAGWDSTAVELGAGVRPDLLVAENGSPFVVWCAGEGGVAFWSEGQSEVISSFSCQGGPSVAVDGEGRAHVVWQSDQVEDVLGEVRREDVLYETIGDGDSWGEPMIVARLERSADHGLADGPAGDLHLAWTGIDPAIQYARQQSYECDSETLSGAEAELYEVARMGGYRPEGDVIPFCQNQYQMMLFTPTVDPSFSAADPTLNGGYDDYAELLQTADYEALFTTMAYEKAVNQDSPGAVLARGVMDLYEKVKANPEDYPRGMLVRILLGNSPSPSFELLELDGGLWYVLNDLQEAGLEKMIDPEVGWRVEVANFAGRWPHSHVKTMIVDGKTVVASGFNHEYKPLSKDHPSGKGLGDTDTGLVITGPVAQHSRLIYDQLWTGAIQRHCPDLSASEVELRLTCEDSRGVPDHVPEVMRYWLTDNEAIAFSMFRNRIYDEADQQLLEAYGAAQQSIDLAQAMFSMPLICNLNHFFEVCNFDQALPYMEALMDAADQGARVRILLTPYPIQNVENVIAMEIFNKEAIERGLAHSVEIRMLDDLLHSKSALIDGEFVIVGSQNLHWSAFGVDNGLSEYSLGAGDPGAAEQYQRFFDYLWERAPSHAETAN
jgi:phosphatidylserine/phosphatidylglycerophosphate/cardiolipin synthase-like enzyme